MFQALYNNFFKREEPDIRLEEELSVIRDKKFAPYFLVVRNMINWAKKEGIMVKMKRSIHKLIKNESLFHL